MCKLVKHDGLNPLEYIRNNSPFESGWGHL